MVNVESRARTAEIASSAEVPPSNGISPRLGFQLKRERLLMGLRLIDVAEAAGLSPSLISKIERGKVNPSLSTLHRLAQVLCTNVSALFEMGEKHDKVVLTHAERPVAGKVQDITQWEGIEAEIMVPHERGRLLEGFVFVLEPGGHSGGVLQHDGEECGYVLEGELKLTVDGQVYMLKPGDSFFFYSDLQHAYSNPGNVTARVIWINTPPTF
jgi:transcriptional regulator with XRE-family HTH domain